MPCNRALPYTWYARVLKFGSLSTPPPHLVVLSCTMMEQGNKVGNFIWFQMK